MITEEYGNTENVFEDSREIDRLALQNDILRNAQMPVLERVFSDFKAPTVLDIGCNNGAETYRRFSGFGPSAVIGIEISPSLVESASEKYGSSVFSFFVCSAEDERFLQNITGIMASKGISSFDIIHISLVLLHLKNPAVLLKKLRLLLSEHGKIIIIEPDDSQMISEGDESGTVRGFMKLMSYDPFAGNRFMCHRISGYLNNAGYKNIEDIPVSVSAEAGNRKLCTDIYNMYFTFMEEDARLLANDTVHGKWADSASEWLDSNRDKLKSLYDGSFGVRMVMRMFIADAGTEYLFSDSYGIPGGFTLSPLKYEELDSALSMFDSCVGRGLYTRNDLYEILVKPLHYILILRDSDGTYAGYLCFMISDAAETAEDIKIEPDRITALSGKSSPVTACLRSIGLMPPYRGRHLANSVTHQLIHMLNISGYDILLGAFWKVGDIYPIHKVVDSFGFRFDGIIRHPWSDVKTLYCPVCGGRCMCDAGLFYIKPED